MAKGSIIAEIKIGDISYIIAEKQISGWKQSGPSYFSITVG
jgi:hypothetical protein